jgi:hypothetical protein
LEGLINRKNEAQSRFSGDSLTCTSRDKLNSFHLVDSIGIDAISGKAELPKLGLKL